MSLKEGVHQFYKFVLKFKVRYTDRKSDLEFLISTRSRLPTTSMVVSQLSDTFYSLSIPSSKKSS